MIYFTKLQIVSNEKIVKLVIFSFVGFFTDHNISQVDLTGFSAKSIASGHFIDKRSKETIEKETMIESNRFSYMSSMKGTICDSFCLWIERTKRFI
jgi:hypothetical protein